MSGSYLVSDCRPFRTVKSENGVALLISIFVLLLVCVVAIALIVSAGTESALSGNYRSATTVYYAALAGLEEARGRMLVKNPDYFLSYKASFLPAPGNPLPLGSVSYLLNPIGSETIAPWDSSSLYPDAEYFKEFGSNPPSSSPQMQWINSVSGSNTSNVQGPLFKWVRINAVTELSLGINVNNSSGPLDNTIPVYYDGAHLNLLSNGAQVLSITSFAVLPNGSSKLLQYTVATNLVLVPPFPAAITLLGNNVDYTGPDSNTWVVTGNDSGSLGSCNPGQPVYAVGYSNNSDNSSSNIDQGTFTAHASKYTGYSGLTPNLGYIAASIPANLKKPSELDNMAQAITQIADTVVTPPSGQPAHGSDLPSAMSPSNLMTTVVNGDLDLTGWHTTGYGLLLVTGNLIYDPDASWNGIVMLIGQGTMTGSHTGSGQFLGAIFAAKTRDTTGSLFPDPNLPNNNGAPGTFGTNFQFAPNMGGAGVSYSSCWIKAATPGGTYTVLSFHEITQ